MEKTLRLVDKIILTGKEDENVLYMLVSRAEDFNKAFGRKFIEKIVKKLYPGGLRELTRTIQTKYKKRGFPQISKLLNKSLKSLTPHGS